MGNYATNGKCFLLWDLADQIPVCPRGLVRTACQAEKQHCSRSLHSRAHFGVEKPRRAEAGREEGIFGVGTGYPKGPRSQQNSFSGRCIPWVVKGCSRRGRLGTEGPSRSESLQKENCPRNWTCRREMRVAGPLRDGTGARGWKKHFGTSNVKCRYLSISGKQAGKVEGRTHTPPPVWLGLTSVYPA